MTATEHADALLAALRSNLDVLGELAVRYEVETRPDREAGRADQSVRPRTCSACWGRRWGRSRRSNCACCCSTAATASSASG